MEFSPDLDLPEMNLQIRTTALDNATACYCAELEARSLVLGGNSNYVLHLAKGFEEYLRGDLFAQLNEAPHPA